MNEINPSGRFGMHRATFEFILACTQNRDNDKAKRRNIGPRYLASLADSRIVRVVEIEGPASETPEGLVFPGRWADCSQPNWEYTDGNIVVDPDNIVQLRFHPDDVPQEHILTELIPLGRDVADLSTGSTD